MVFWQENIRWLVKILPCNWAIQTLIKIPILRRCLAWHLDGSKTNTRMANFGIGCKSSTNSNCRAGVIIMCKCVMQMLLFSTTNWKNFFENNGTGRIKSAILPKWFEMFRMLSAVPQADIQWTLKGDHGTPHCWPAIIHGTIHLWAIKYMSLDQRPRNAKQAPIRTMQGSAVKMNSTMRIHTKVGLSTPK